MASVDRDAQSPDGTTSGDNWTILQSDMEASTNEASPDKCLMQRTMLMSPTKDQYIKLRSSSDEGLPYSAKIRYGSTYWKLHGEQRLVTIGSDYVAQVSVEPSAELNSVSDFQQAKKILLGLVITEKVHEDKLRRKISDLASSIQKKLAEHGDECGQCSKSGQLFEIRRLAEKHCYDVGFDFCKEMCSNKSMFCKSLKVDIVMYSAMQNCLKDRSIFLRDDKWAIGLDKEKQMLEDFFKAVMEKHRNLLLGSCSPLMENELKKMDADRFLLLTMADVKIFSDMEFKLKGKVLQEALPVIIRNYIKRIRAFDCSQSLPAVNEIYFYVCKSLMEISTRVESKLAIQNSITFERTHWKISPDAIITTKTPVEKCLVNQLHMLVVFAACFEPGNPTDTLSIYDRNIELFKSFTFSQSEQTVWSCMVDAGMICIFRRDFKRIDEFSEMLTTFLQFLVSIGQQTEVQDSMRMVAHIILDFAAVVEQNKFGAEQDEIGKDILRKQLPFICQAIRQSQTDYAGLKDLASVFQDCWTWSKSGFSKLMNKLNGKYLAVHLNELQSKLLHIVLCALDRDVSVDEVTTFFRAFNELAMDLESLSFEWYVRVHNEKICKTLFEKKAIQAQRGPDNDCFLVIEDKYDEFIEICTNEVIPKHYQVEIVKTLLDYIALSLEKRSWNNGVPLTATDQLNVSIALIDAIRTSLFHLKEQPNYPNFMQFYKERTKPFKSIIKECGSLSSLTKRLVLLKQSFRYTRNQHIIDVDKAIGLFTTLNRNCQEDLLKNSFKLYVGQFEKHIRECNDLEYADKIKRIVRHVKDKICPMETTKWTAGFKQNSIPLILAGVRAVWSVLTTVDSFNAGKFVMSHSLQILTILRLLCVDNKVLGVENHLAQVLTEQGKSLVLGLVATVLALFGHKVEIAYHSEHLAKRDAAQLGDLYDAFAIKSKIYYRTIDDLADERMRSYSEKAWLYVSKCIGIPYESAGIDTQGSTDLSNTVLLMNEFDVFLDKHCGLMNYNVFAPEITGLGKIQQKIWEFVQAGREDIECQIESFVQSSSDPDIETLKALIERPGSYKLLSIDHHGPKELMFTNKTFFALQLSEMVKTAKDVHSGHEDYKYSPNCNLDSNGAFHCQKELGEFCSNYYCQYFNAFKYFQLKKDNFVQNVNGFANFGYLPLDFSTFSYAKILDYYPLVLCCTERLEDFKPITQNTLLPSFFGSSKLKFNQQEHFQCLSSPSEWRKAIFTRINDIIKENRSVVVFFGNYTVLKQFSLEFKQQIDRLNELTVITEDSNWERYVHEAGVPRTVTLATREMARAVDFEPSLAVEENGGIHVIQTFFSLMEHSESRYRGRTARMGNAGSYELIVARPHLFTCLMGNDAANSVLSYAQLDKYRKNMTKNLNEQRADYLRSANQKHTMAEKFYETI
nr:uncharacterized protein LOC109408862 [Aedes albopictus]